MLTKLITCVVLTLYLIIGPGCLLAQESDSDQQLRRDVEMICLATFGRKIGPSNPDR